MHVWLALLSIVVKFNSVKSLQSHFWEGKHLRNGHISLSQPWLIQALPGVVPSTCVCTRPRVCVSGSTARMFGSAETLANPLCASQCPVSEELWPLSSCSLLKPPKEKGKKGRGSRENANESQYTPKLVQRDTLLGQTHTEAHAVQYMCRFTLTCACMHAFEARLGSWLCSARILRRFKWSRCNYISHGAGKL